MIPASRRADHLYDEADMLARLARIARDDNRPHSYRRRMKEAADTLNMAVAIEDRFDEGGVRMSQRVGEWFDAAEEML